MRSRSSPDVYVITRGGEATFTCTHLRNELLIISNWLLVDRNYHDELFVYNSSSRVFNIRETLSKQILSFLTVVR